MALVAPSQLVLAGEHQVAQVHDTVHPWSTCRPNQLVIAAPGWRLLVLTQHMRAAFTFLISASVGARPLVFCQGNER